MKTSQDSTNLNIKSKYQQTYDAIVIGSGISGGWAAKELCEKGLRTLVLERGRNVEHIKDYPTANQTSLGIAARGKVNDAKMREENPIVSKCYAFNESTNTFLLKDKNIHTHR